MKWFKSLWFNMRKSNLLPGNEVLIPMKETPQTIADEHNDTIKTKAPAKKRGRKKKEVQNEIAPTNIA
jgi:phosphoenolpyruvate carboxylase